MMSPNWVVKWLITGFDSRPATLDLKNSICRLSSLVLDINEWMQQHSLQMWRGGLMVRAWAT